MSLTDAADRFALLDLSDPPSRPVAPRVPATRAPAPMPAPAPAPIVEAPAPAPAPVEPAPTVASTGPTAAQVAAARRGDRTVPMLPTNAELAARAAARAATAATEAPAPAPIPGATSGSIADALGVAVSEGQRMAATANLVRGGVLRPDVNPVAGYNVPVVAARGEATRYADAARNVNLGPDAAPAAAVTHAALLKGADIVAGATKVRDGAVVAWDGSGKRTRGQIQATLAAAGLPVEWAPEAKAAKAHAGQIMAGIHTDGMTAKSVDCDGKTPETRGWLGKWNIGHTGDLANRKVVGDRFGDVAMIATLGTDEILSVDVGNNPHLASTAASIVARYNARRAAEEFSSGDVTTWLASVMRTRLRGVKFGPLGYYVKADNAERAERLVNAFKAEANKWGSWMMIPVATSEALRHGLVESLVDEARVVLVDYAKARDEAAEAGKKAVSDERLTTLRSRMRTVLDKAQGYAALLGDAMVANLRKAVKAAVEEIEPQLSTEAVRFAGIWDDLRAEGVLSDSIPAAIETDVTVAAPTAVPVAVEPVASAPTVAVAVAPAPVPVAVPVERVSTVTRVPTAPSNVIEPTALPSRRGPAAATVATTAPVAAVAAPLYHPVTEGHYPRKGTLVALRHDVTGGAAGTLWICFWQGPNGRIGVSREKGGAPLWLRASQVAVMVDANNHAAHTRYEDLPATAAAHADALAAWVASLAA